MRQQAKELYHAVRAAHHAVIDKFIDLQRVGHKCDLKELADDVYALDQSLKLLAGMKTEVNKQLEMTKRAVCLRYVAECTDGEPIRTEHCTATPDAKTTVALPPKGSSEWNSLLSHFGVPADAPFQPDWNKMIERVTQEMADGKPCPPGCDPNKMYVIPQVKIFKRKPILDNGTAVSLQDNGALLYVERALDAWRKGLDADAKQFAERAYSEQRIVDVEEDKQEAKPVKHDNVPEFMRRDPGEGVPF